MGPHLAAPRTEWTVDELRYYLSLITPEAMRYDGTRRLGGRRRRGGGYGNGVRRKRELNLVFDT